MAGAVLVQGGTFDPVHYGHLQTARDVAALLGVQQIRLIPCGDPAHRPAPGATAVQRLAMLQAAVGDESRFTIDAQELHRQGPSYMVDTAISLRQELGDQVPICLMMGSDAFLGLPSWHRWQEILDYLSLVVVKRPGWGVQPSNIPLEKVLAACQVGSVDELLAVAAGRILMVSVSLLDISATDIRRRLAAGKSVEGLVPDEVLALIQQQNLYKNGCKG